MPSEISKELFEHLVELAALGLKPEEAEYLHNELNKQLNVIEELASISLDDSISAASHGVPYSASIRPPLREDQIIPSGISTEILDQTPETEAGYIVVPKIPHETLE
ncbi:MAG TPA: Asp-tRNA(Asn)/Glu-tRNA(Gln) amidotransferase subunit GatC [Anaerolineales bacterium]|nr:Asp-tRNA(Asn)/Glu-tRNA(Gln) amidotransferase subunit GatC [Anaerolineales bacterium]